MKTIRKEEIVSLISQIENEEIKKELNNFIKFDEVDTETFFNKIKSLNITEDNDYQLFLLLEEFYLRFKDLR